jgi:polar amino acid transport system substrate-binding protein
MKTILLGCLLLGLIGLHPAIARDRLVISALENSKLGLMVEAVLETAYDRIGIEVETAWLPGARALQMADDGAVDGAQLRVASIQQRFTNLLIVPVPVYISQIVVFSRTVDFPVQGWESLKPYRIAAPGGYTAILDHITGFMHWAVTYEQIFRMLDGGRVDIGVVDRFNGLVTLNTLKLEGIKTLKPPVSEVRFYHFLHRRHAALVPEITAALQQLDASGEITAIWARFEREFMGAAYD